MLVDEFVFLSNWIGRDFNLVQGSGGNVSVKIQDNLMLVKASGVSLSSVGLNSGYCSVQLCPRDRSSKSSGPFFLSSDDTSLRPSLETSFHALLDWRFVAHVHPSSLMPALCSDLSQLRRLIAGCGYKVEVVEYIKPGIELALAINKLICRNGLAQVYLLRNHGVIVGADRGAEVIDLIGSIVSFGARRRFNSEVELGESVGEKRTSGMMEVQNDLVRSLALDDISYDIAINSRCMFSPDQAVFLYDVLTQNAEEFLNDSRFDAAIIKGQGVFVRPDRSWQFIQNLKAYADVLTYMPRNYEMLARLSDTQIRELVTWDAEIYRKELRGHTC